jgi:Undecaprenyl-phosphate galactose phosphotransferase WbaP
MNAAVAQPAFRVPSIKSSSGWTTFCVVLVDAFALEIALYCGCLSRLALHSFFSAAIGRQQYEGLSLGILTLPLAYYWAGLYPAYGMGGVQRLRKRVYTTLLVFTVLLTWNYIYQNGEWSRGVLLCTMVFALAIPPALESLARKLLTRAGLSGVPVVVLGAGETGEAVVRRLNKDSDLGLVPIAVLDDDPIRWGTSIDNIPVAGPLSEAGSFQDCARVVVIAMPEIDRDRLVGLVEGLSFPKVIVIPDLPGLQTLWTISRDLGGILGLELRKNLLIAKNRLLKRILDYVIAVPLFVLSVPILACFAIWIKIVSPGPAFFRQEREGADGRRIRVWKLRTMYPDSEFILTDYLARRPDQKAAWFKYYKLKNDPRVLPGVGTFLRRTSLDEVPQLLNVLLGQMSLVGPRPFPQYHLACFSRSFRKLRGSVTPGLTGLWQVSERSDGDISVQETLDTYYIRNWSLWLDIYILLRTIQTVVLPRGAY